MKHGDFEVIEPSRIGFEVAKLSGNRTLQRNIQLIFSVKLQTRIGDLLMQSLFQPPEDWYLTAKTEVQPYKGGCDGMIVEAH